MNSSTPTNLSTTISLEVHPERGCESNHNLITQYQVVFIRGSTSTGKKSNDYRVYGANIDSVNAYIDSKLPYTDSSNLTFFPNETYAVFSNQAWLENIVGKWKAFGDNVTDHLKDGTVEDNLLADKYRSVGLRYLVIQHKGTQMLRPDQVDKFTNTSKNARLYIEIKWVAKQVSPVIPHPSIANLDVTEVYIPNYCIKGYGLYDYEHDAITIANTKLVYQSQKWFFGHVLGNDNILTSASGNTRQIAKFGAIVNPGRTALLEVEMDFSQIKFNDHVHVPIYTTFTL